MHVDHAHCIEPSLDIPQDGDEGDAEDDAERKLKRKGNRSEATLVKDFSSIKVKKLDLDFTVDPLFKKTSADFDEGGARGLLLNNLAVDRDCKIIFDASDAFADADDEENSPKPAEEQPKKEPDDNEMLVDTMDVEAPAEAHDEKKVEVSRLKGERATPCIVLYGLPNEKLTSSVSSQAPDTGRAAHT